jgi:hypothetical protein
VTRVLQTSPSHSRTTGGVLVHVYGRNFLDTQSLSVRYINPCNMVEKIQYIILPSPFLLIFHARYFLYVGRALCLFVKMVSAFNTASRPSHQCLCFSPRHSFGAVVTPGSFKSHQLLTCIAPAHPPGVVSVEVCTLCEPNNPLNPKLEAHGLRLSMLYPPI